MKLQDYIHACVYTSNLSAGNARPTVYRFIYGVSTISRLLKCLGLFRRISSVL